MLTPALAIVRAPVRSGEILIIEGEATDITDKTLRVDDRIPAEPTLGATGFERRAWVGRPARAPDRPRARPVAVAISRTLGGG